ncbi:MAG: DUF2066 domain-containing protein [Halofilum sp. (in: g-proteobacteria)]|nr:DUF2066 domain-containing protein [Halofilum sp. (in: g-proteobacteria)]
MRPLPKCLLPLLILVLLSPATARAVRVEGLYRAAVEVVDKGGEARVEGFRAGLEQVLVRLTGSTEVVADESLAPVLEQPARYVQQYRYEELEDEPGDGGDSTNDRSAPDSAEAAEGEEAEPEPQYRLRVVFAQRSLERLLEERDIPVWDVYRPQVLVWLAFDDGRRRSLVAADDDSGIDEALREVAERRGLPLLLPLLDTEDQRRVEYFDIQGGFLDRVREASSRYNAPLVLVGHVYRGNGDWRGEWTLLEPEDRSGWLTRSEEPEQAVHAGIGGLADRLAARLAGREGELRAVRIRIEDTAALNDYARLSRYLQRLPRVDGHRLVRVRPRELVFELSLRGQLSDLERAIAVDNLLAPVGDGQAAAAAGVEVPTPISTVDGTDEAAGEADVTDIAADPSGGPVDGAGFGADGGVGSGDFDAGSELVYRLTG